MSADGRALSPLKRAYLALEEMEARLEAAERSNHEPVAIVGIGCRLPGGVETPEGFWHLLHDGIDAVGEIPSDRFDIDDYYDPDPETPGKIASRYGAFLDGVDLFDPGFFGIAPREAKAMDPQHRLLLEVAWEALEHAGQAPDRLVGSRTGVFVGIVNSDYQQLHLQAGGAEGIGAYFGSGSARSIASGRLSYLLGLRGPSISIDTACSSSLVAIHLGVRALRAREADLALAGGANVILAPETSIALSKLRMLAPDGRCKAFDAAADGFVRAEGCAVVVLKRLADALADRDRILAIVRGTAVNQDGEASGLTAPSGPAQEAVIREALLDGAVRPADVGYVEAHGTGTALGDPIEVQALAAALGPGRTRPFAIGSVKTNLGHLESAAGVTGLVKAVLALQHRELPPHLHLTRPNPHVRWSELPVVVPTEPTPWPAEAPLIAGVSSFGFSGTNAHIVLEAAPDVAPVRPAATDRPLHVLTLSAPTAEGLQASAGRLSGFLADRPQEAFSDVAFTANIGRARFSHRLAVVAADAADAGTALAAAAAGEPLPPGAFAGELDGDDRPRVAFLFSGQGSQYASMGRELYETQPTFRAAFDRCDELFRARLGSSLMPVLFPADGASSPIDETLWSQPALFALEVALTELLASWGIRPSAVLGHSVGEYAAGWAAGLYGLEDGVALISERARLMHELPRGAMAAVTADEERIAAALEPHGDVVIACVNAPDRVVVSGPESAVDAALADLDRDGVDARRLSVSHAFHSPLVEPMLDAFGQAAARVHFSAPSAKFVSSSSGRAEPFATLESPEYWRRQVRDPVRFVAAVESLHELGCAAVLEIGPKPTLLAIARRCLPDADVTWLPTLAPDRAWSSLLGTVASLSVLGVDVDWRGFDGDYPRRLCTLPPTPFQRSRHWIEGSVGRRRHGPLPGAHPLVGRRLESPLAEAQFEQELDPERCSLLADHRVGGRAVLPAAAFVEAALAAGRQVLGEVPTVENLTIQQPLDFPDGQPRTVHTIVRQTGGATAAVEVYSAQPPASSAQAEWRLHATAELASPATGGGACAEPEELRQRLGDEVSAEDHYDQLAARGIDLGPSLRGVTAIWRGEGEALARVGAFPTPAGETYELHPALADACLQALAACVRDADDAFLPLGIDRVLVCGSPGEAVWSHASLRQSDGPRTLVGDVRVLDRSGRIVAELQGVRLARARDGVRAQRIDDWLYELTWSRTGPTPTRVRPTAIAAEIEPRLTELAQLHELDRQQALVAGLDAAATAYAVSALRELGWAPRVGGQLTVASLAADGGVVEHHRDLLKRLLETLAEDGALEQAGEQWTVRSLPAYGDPDRMLSELCTRYPAARAHAELVGRCGRALAAALRGTVDPLELLFPGGSLDEVETVYRDSPEGRVFTGLVASTVTAVLGRLDPSRPLRVLEVGAGTGATAASVLPVLPSGRAEYLFTDVSPRFLARARDRFADYPFLRTALLDLEHDPAEQGVEVGGWDVVLAVDVLHATRDLRESLATVRRLLAPGGVLVLVEGSAPERWVDITFGLTEGWWRFRDRGLRRSSPLLPYDSWLELLAAEGFSDATAVQAAESSNQVLLLAQAPDSTEAVSEPTGGTWVVLADAGGIGEELAARVVAAGGACVVVRAEGSARDDVGRLLEETAARGPLRGIVHLGSLDQVAAADAELGSLAARQADACGSALQLVRALAERSDPNVDPPRLWFVTRGAQTVGGAEAPTAVEQAPLVGLGKVVALEHPEFACTCVDLDPATSDGAEQLWDELRLPGREDQIAYRGGERHVARVRRASVRPAGTPVRLHLPADGVLDDIAIEPAERRPPGPGEVEIRVSAAGLNFRDVLNALALRRDSEPLGGECAGTIVAVGEGVTDLASGDEVVAVVPGCFASFVTARTGLVARRPKRLSPAEAATIPIAYMTARYALLQLGRLAAGERVLIHSAAGGVGLAAVALAREAGAEIFATAGSPEKREFLHARGVAHVMDSRSPAFADEVLAATGGRGVDVVLNSLAGEFIPASFSVLAEGGRFLELGKRGIWTAEQAAEARPDVQYAVVDLAEHLLAGSPLVHELFFRLVADAAAGAVEPLPVTSFALEGAAEAFRHVAQGRHVGKVVLVPPRQPTAIGALVRPDASYLVTGGLGGLGLETARKLAEGGARHLVLMGRGAPSEPAREVIAELESAGTRVTVAQGDVSRPADVAAALELAEEGATLRGIVHSAGVLDDSSVLRQEWPRFEAVLAPKVDGAWNLHALTRERALDFFVLYSSSAALLGSPGQGSHAAANAFLDALAHHRRRLGLPSLSIGWGPWADIGAAARLGVAERVSAEGVVPMRTHEGLEALERASLVDGAYVAVLPVDWSRYLVGARGRIPLLAEIRAQAAPATARDDAPSSPRPPSDLVRQLAAAGSSRRKELLLEFVSGQARHVLGLADGQPLAESRPLQELGLDSLMAVELRNVLGVGLELSQPLPVTLVFDYPTARSISEYLERLLEERIGGGSPGAEEEAEPADLVDTIASLTDEDVERLLVERGTQGTRGTP